MRPLLLLLILSACQTHSQWNYCSIPTKGSGICTRAIYHSDDEVLGIDIEFLRTSKGLATYLNMHSPIREQAEIHLKKEQGAILFTLPIHKGGERIRLSETMQNELIAALKEGESLSIEVEGSSQTIHPENFKKVLKQLENPPKKLPFHLFF